METLILDHTKGILSITINNGKVNAINTLLAQELATTFEEAQSNDQVKGIILQGRPDCFSAGLDIISLATYNGFELREFWKAYMSALRNMVNYTKPFVCAITGYAPAGGTIFTLCADYRIMAEGEKHVIGMHEFNMSLQIPRMLIDIYAYHLGEKKAWEAVLAAKLYHSQEAIDVGLVNESVETEQVIPRAQKMISKLTSVNPSVFQDSKSMLRKGLSKIVSQPLDPLLDEIIDQTNNPETKRLIELFVKSLKK